MKLICFYQKRALVPENRAGSVIAQRTDRQATLPFDFLSVKFPQIAIPSIREIRVSTHINLELRSEFIAAFAKSAVKPLNAFTSDLGRAIPSTLAPDLKATTPANINLNPRSSTDTDSKIIAGLETTLIALISQIQKDESVMMDTDTFRSYFRGELLASGLDTEKFDRMWRAAQSDVRETEKALEKERTEHFHLLRNYLDAAAKETQMQEKMIDRLSHQDRALSDIPRAFFISDEKDISKEAYEKYQKFTSTSEELPVSSYEEAPLKQISSLQGQMHRLIATTNGGSVSA